MFCFLDLLLLVGIVAGSHYRGGSMSWSIRSIPENITNSSQIPVRITQRHSWRRSYYFCNNTDPNSGDIIGEDLLISNRNPNVSLLSIPSINAKVRCTDFNEEFDYSSGETSTTVFLPINRRIEYTYSSCCWIPLLPPDRNSDWSLKLVINTNRRLDGNLNNSPKTTMNPIVQLQVGKIHVIHIPMADSDGDIIRCRWGNTSDECGSICSSKGLLNSNPCELTYNASQIGHQAIAIIIEDFDSNDNVLSTIPLQFIIHIVNTTNIDINSRICSEPPVYIGDWSQDSCIGVESNITVNARIQIRIPCSNTSTVLDDILTISPAGLTKGQIIRDSLDPNLYTMFIQWTPESDQYGIQQLCVTPVDSQQQTGSQVCLTFQVDIRSPEFILLTPTGIVPSTQALWIIETDRDIVRPKQSRGIYIRFFKKSTNQEVYRIDVTTDVTVVYQSRQIIFYTTGYTWQPNEVYYILLDSGIATINESCGIESAPINDPHAWVFHIPSTETTVLEERITTKKLLPSISPTKQPISIPRRSCPRWLSFDTILNQSTSANESLFTFCFSVETLLADVVISANTWIPCLTWKLSGAADPLLELYSESNGELLAENDDGNSLALTNCYAAVLSYRLQKGDYRVIIRNPKCAYGKFELRLSTETNRHFK